MVRVLPLVLMLLAGCPKQSAPTPTDYGLVPRLPAPTAGAYVRHPEPSPDPIVRHLIGERPLMGSLSGGASSLALALERKSIQSLSQWRVRHAAWKAGWLYPVDTAKGWFGIIAAPPPAATVQWLSTVPEDTDLGFVRARTEDEELWIALTSRPRVDLGTINRQHATGAPLRLPAHPGVRYTIADPAGFVRTGTLDEPLSLSLDSAGEWLVQLNDSRGVVALFPLHVGMTIPLQTLDSYLAPTPTSADEAMDQAEDMLAEIRAIYGSDPLVPDRLADAAAASVLRGDASDQQRLLRTLGVDHLARIDCTSQAVQSCIDDLLWDPTQRRALLAEGALLGIAADQTPTGFRLVALLLSEDNG